MRHLLLAAALVLGLIGSAQAGFHAANAVSSNSVTGEAVRLAQSSSTGASLAVIVAPKRIDTDQEIVDFTGRAMAPGEVTLTVNGLQGGLLVMISHGISTGALFLLLGMLYERRHTRTIADFGGIARVAPWFATAFVITALTSIGLPGTSGFVGEFLALLGTFETHPVIAFLATLGVIFAAYYMLPMVQTIFFNELNKDENRDIQDLSPREMTILAPLCALMLVIGWNPTPILERMEPSVRAVIERVEAASPQASILEQNDIEIATVPPWEGADAPDEPTPDGDDAEDRVTDGDEQAG